MALNKKITTDVIFIFEGTGSREMILLKEVDGQTKSDGRTSHPVMAVTWI